MEEIRRFFDKRKIKKKITDVHKGKTTRLDLSDSNLKEFPEEILKLTNLRELLLFNNNLVTVPSKIAQLTNLTYLDLSNNQLSQLPAGIAKLTNLTTLLLDNNNITQLPPDFPQLNKLKQLSLHGNNLKQLPPEVSQLINLSELFLGQNSLTALPPEFSNLSNLEELYLFKNKLTQLPSEIVQLTNLKKLYLFDNHITELLPKFTQLTNLTTLSLAKNQLTKLPQEVIQLNNLKELFLWDNQLSELPPEINQLSNLTEIDITNNHLTQLPPEICQLSDLTVLILNLNQLITLPKHLLNLQKLEILSLEGNPLPGIPPELLSGWEIPLEYKYFGSNANITGLREYFAALEEEGEDHLYEAKVLVLGEGGAGKTSLSKKIIDPDYQLKEEEISTEGIEVLEHTFTCDNGESFQANLWDFGGQEIYHATHQFFLTKRSLYLLVADSRKEDTDFNYWLDVSQLYGGDSPLLIIKNEKQDRKRTINESELYGRFNRNLKDILATNLATNRGLPEVIENMQDYLARLPHIGTPLPKTWVAVRRALEAHPDDTITLEEYIRICEGNGYGAEKALTLSGFLHDLGAILHFQDNPNSPLRNLVILKPEWGVDAAYAVLDNNTVINNHGRFTAADLDDIWGNPRYDRRRPELLELMIKFNLCYKIPGKAEYIAPQLLEANQPDYIWDETDNLHLRYSYDFMPKGLILRLIVALHDLIEDQEKTVWRTGMVLAQNGARAEVIEVYREREIKIRVSGINKKTLLSQISRELEKIHNSFQGRLVVKRLIPCNCEQCTTGTPEFYEEKTLLRYRDEKRDSIECRRSFEAVPVLPLIEDTSLFERIGMEEEIFMRDPKLAHRLGRKPKLKKEVFVSFPWDDEGSGMADRLQAEFKKFGITVRRDKDDIGYRDRIKQFMQEIGRGHVVLAVVDEKYLKSPNCMFELLELAKNKDFEARLFPIVLDDARFYTAKDQIKLLGYWKQQIQELTDLAEEQGLDVTEIASFSTELMLLAEIKQALPRLLQTLKDMNALSVKMHIEEDFKQLIEQVLARLEE